MSSGQKGIFCPCFHKLPSFLSYRGFSFSGQFMPFCPPELSIMNKVFPDEISIPQSTGRPFPSSELSIPRSRRFTPQTPLFFISPCCMTQNTTNYKSNLWVNWSSSPRYLKMERACATCAPCVTQSTGGTLWFTVIARLRPPSPAVARPPHLPDFTRFHRSRPDPRLIKEPSGS